MVAAIVTAFLAVFVFVLTQSFLKLVLEPVQDQRRLIGEVAHALLFYANVLPAESIEVNDNLGERTLTIGADPEELEEVQKTLRELAGRLRASLWSIPGSRYHSGISYDKETPCRLGQPLKPIATRVPPE